MHLHIPVTKTPRGTRRSRQSRRGSGLARALAAALLPMGTMLAGCFLDPEVTEHPSMQGMFEVSSGSRAATFVEGSLPIGDSPAPIDRGSYSIPETSEFQFNVEIPGEATELIIGIAANRDDYLTVAFVDQPATADGYYVLPLDSRESGKTVTESRTMTVAVRQLRSEVQNTYTIQAAWRGESQMSAPAAFHYYPDRWLRGMDPCRLPFAIENNRLDGTWGKLEGTSWALFPAMMRFRRTFFGGGIWDDTQGSGGSYGLGISDSNDCLPNGAYGVDVMLKQFDGQRWFTSMVSVFIGYEFSGADTLRLEGNWTGHATYLRLTPRPSSELPPNMTMVPYIVSLPKEEATFQLDRAGLQNGRVDEIPNDLVSPGTVVAQSPAGGTAVPIGSSVNMSVARATPPTITIDAARMVGADTLGVDATVSFSKWEDREGQRLISLRATINGQEILERISVKDRVGPGEPETRIEWVYGHLLQVELSRAHDPEGNPATVPRFETGQNFTLTAEAWGEAGGESSPSRFDVVIPLPVMVVHGVTKDLLQDTFFFLPYEGLQGFLADNGYDADPSLYRTLWGPPGIHYSSQESTPAEVGQMLKAWIDQAVGSTYADKVDLIGHSLGGLLCRYYATEVDVDRRVRRVIMVGTPNEGSSEFYVEAFTHPKDWADKKLHTTEGEWNVRSLLAPTYPTLWISGSQEQVPNPLPNTFHEGGFNKPAPPGVEYWTLFTDRSATKAKLFVTPISDGWFTYDGVRASDNGDGTVLVTSAQTCGTPVCVSTPTKHGMLPSDAAVEAEILSILQSR